jgi:ketopantoate reductase
MVIVPTRHYELIEALQQFVPQTKDAKFILLTQNWHGTADVDTIIPQTRYVYGDAKAGGTFRDGVLVATISTIDVGQVGGRHDDCLARSITLFGSADLAPRLRENILHYLWVQYAITGGLWPSLVRAGSFEALLRDRHAGELGMMSARECLDVVARRGVDVSQYPETRLYYRNSFVLRQLALMTMRFMFTHNEYVKRSSAHALANAREIKTFFYDLLNTGRELGVKMPVMSSFERDIKEFCNRTEKHDGQLS